MANPQKEDGYTAIANEIMEALCRHRIPGEDRQVLDVIFRKTYGFNKIEDYISLSQFVEMTGMKKPNIIRSLKSLLSKRIIIIQMDNGFRKVYRINKDFDKWERYPNRSLLSKRIIGVIQKDNPALSKRIPTKDNVTKDTITKTKAQAPVLPEWIPKQTFEEYLEMRRKMRKPLMERSYSRFFSHLKRLCGTSRATPEQILDQSIINGWQGIFELKTGGANGDRPAGRRMGGDRLPAGIIPKEYTGDGPRPEVSPETVRKNLERIKALTGGVGKGGADTTDHAGDERTHPQNAKGHSGGADS
ncbi:MAG: replication protein [Sphaerochaeta sp.]|jgi:phage replication O-like protein O|nr:replication protein [Sphaerochaeta sp.]